MNCSVTMCERDAVVMVLFAHGTRPYPFCRFHAFTRKGHPVWKPQQLLSISHLR